MERRKVVFDIKRSSRNLLWRRYNVHGPPRAYDILPLDAVKDISVHWPTINTALGSKYLELIERIQWIHQTALKGRHLEGGIHTRRITVWFSLLKTYVNKTIC
jgi:hypothetical protein